MLKDKDIREPLFEFLEITYGKVRIIEEKQIGKSRADIMAVLEASLMGIEIKSDADTYARLERQVRDYNRFFDYCVIAVGSSHALHVDEHIPPFWGIIIVEEKNGEVGFCIKRQPLPNPKREKRVKLRNQLSFLWRPELAHLQELNGLPKYKAKSKLFVMEKLMEKVETGLLKQQISTELFERDYTTIQQRIAEYKEQAAGK